MDFRFKPGSVPLLLSMPHAGTDIPDDIAANMAPCALVRADTDWHLPDLYAFADSIGASTLSARWSRYVIDLNRPPEDTNLYPGQDTTRLCPVDTFARERLYQDGREPDAGEIERRLDLYWRPSVLSDQSTSPATQISSPHLLGAFEQIHSRGKPPPPPES